MNVAIEVKSSDTISSRHLKGLRELKKEHPSVNKCYLVCFEKTKRKTEDGILILPYKDFIELLWSGECI